MILAITLKDLRRTFTSAFSLIMMLAAPFLITGLLYFAFNSQGDETEEFDSLKVELLNLDTGEGAAGFAAGETFTEILTGEELEAFLEIKPAEDRKKSENDVLKGKSDLLLIIPEGFSEAFMGGSSFLELYHDPADTIVPQIGKDLFTGLLRTFSSVRVLTITAIALSPLTGAEVDTALMDRLREGFISRVHDGGGDDGGPEAYGGTKNGRGQPRGGDGAGMTEGGRIIATVMCAMIIFFTFFIGANSAESIVVEKESGTLDRLSTTPASPAEIIFGKMLGVLLIVTIQVAVLVGFSTLFFDIRWSNTPLLILHSFALVIGATGLGVLLMSFIQRTQQVGPMIGGVLSISGMIGGLFTVMVPGMPDIIDDISKAVPQGWVLQGYESLIYGSRFSPFYAIVPVTAGLFFALIGIIILKRRTRR